MGNPFASETEVKILRLLSGEPAGMYGLEIVKASGGKLARGTVYVTLGRMDEKGFVRSHVRGDATHAGLPRPRYTLTGLGAQVLAAADAMGFEIVGA